MRSLTSAGYSLSPVNYAQIIHLSSKNQTSFIPQAIERIREQVTDSTYFGSELLRAFKKMFSLNMYKEIVDLAFSITVSPEEAEICLRAAFESNAGASKMLQRLRPVLSTSQHQKFKLMIGDHLSIETYLSSNLDLAVSSFSAACKRGLPPVESLQRKLVVNLVKERKLSELLKIMDLVSSNVIADEINPFIVAEGRLESPLPLLDSIYCKLQELGLASAGSTAAMIGPYFRRCQLKDSLRCVERIFVNPDALKNSAIPNTLFADAAQVCYYTKQMSLLESFVLQYLSVGDLNDALQFILESKRTRLAICLLYLLADRGDLESFQALLQVVQAKKISESLAPFVSEAEVLMQGQSETWAEILKKLYEQELPSEIWRVAIFNVKKLPKLRKLRSQMEQLSPNVDQFTRELLIFKYLELEDPLVASKLFDRYSEQEYRPSIWLCTAMLESFAQYGQLSKVARLFEKIVREYSLTTEQFDILLVAFSKVKDFAHLDKLLTLARLSFLQPSIDSLIAVLRAYAYKGSMKKVQEILAHFSGAFTPKDRNRLQPILLLGFAKIGDYEKAQEIFDSFMAKGIKVTDNELQSLCSAYLRNDKVEEAIQALKDTRAKHSHILGAAAAAEITTRYIDMKMEEMARDFAFTEYIELKNEFPIHRILSLYVSRGDMRNFCGFLRKFEGYELIDNDILIMAMNGFGRANQHVHALQIGSLILGLPSIMDWVPSKLIKHSRYVSYLSASVKSKRGPLARQDHVSIFFSLMLDACRFLKIGETADKIFRYAQKEFRLKLTANVVTSYIEVLCSQNRGRDALNLVTKMIDFRDAGFSHPVVDKKSYSHLLLMLRKRGQMSEYHEGVKILKTHFPEIETEVMKSL